MMLNVQKRKARLCDVKYLEGKKTALSHAVKCLEDEKMALSQDHKCSEEKIWLCLMTLNV